MPSYSASLNTTPVSGSEHASVSFEIALSAGATLVADKAGPTTAAAAAAGSVFKKARRPAPRVLGLTMAAILLALMLNDDRHAPDLYGRIAGSGLDRNDCCCCCAGSSTATGTTGPGRAEEAVCPGAYRSARAV